MVIVMVVVVVMVLLLVMMTMVMGIVLTNRTPVTARDIVYNTQDLGHLQQEVI